MKRIGLVFLAMLLALSACAQAPTGQAVEAEPQEAAAQEEATQEPGEPTPSAPVLLVSDGATEVAYTNEDLAALGAVEIEFDNAVYVGVVLKTLLADAGFDPAAISAVKALASDGFSGNYGPDLILADTTLVAYAYTDGPLSLYDGIFRMVVPDQAGSMNVRMLSQLTVMQ
jgi:hypothetical protein